MKSLFFKKRRREKESPLKGIDKNTKRLIEKTKDPHLEHIYVKFPGRKLIDVTKFSGGHTVIENEKQIKKLLRKHKKDYLEAHTHPRRAGWNYFKDYGYSSPLPSGGDLHHFLKNKNMKNMLIVQQNAKTGKVEGYLIFRKSKRFKVDAGNIPEDTSEYETLRNQTARSENLRWQPARKDTQVVLNAIERLAKKYGLQYRYIPARGYKVSKNRAWFVEKGLEGKVSVSGVVAIIGLSVSILFLSANLTGNAIGNLTNSTSNIIGAVLLVVGLVAGFFYFKNKKK